MAKAKISMAKVFKTIIWPRKNLLFIGLVLILISRAAGFVVPYLSQSFVDDVLNNKKFEILPTLLLVMSLAIVIQAITSFVLTKILSVEAQHLISVLRSQVQMKILKLPTRFFDNQKSGALVSRVMNDVEGVRNLVGTGFTQLIGGIVSSVIAMILLLKISPLMTLFVLLPMTIFGIISMKAFGMIRPIFRDRGKITADVTGRLTETLSGIRVVKGFNSEQQEIRVFQKGVDSLFQNVKKSLTATSFVTSSGAFLVGMATVGIMALSGHFDLTSGQFIKFSLLMAFMIAPIVQMSNIGSQLTEAFAGLDRTEELMNMPEEDDGTTRTLKVENINGDIKFENVSFSYEEGKEVLHDISFVAPAGSVTALVGTSGSGKTTIAGLAASFLNPTDGLITIDNEDLSKVVLSNYRSNLGVVLQDDFLFEGTIKENILYPRPDSSNDRLMEAVKAAHVNEFTDRFELGLETVIGERGVKLSGGQRQRVAIARAILADPKILILDEATSNLDTESESYIQESLKRLMKGRTTFVIAHRLSTIRQADQILVIEGGKIAERGKHDELIEKKGRYFELYTYQARI